MFRFRGQGAFRLDDVLLIFAFLCLTAALAILYRSCWSIFVSEALAFDPTFTITRQDFESLQDALVTINAFHALAWTAVFATKFSLMSLFWLLVGRISRGLDLYFCGVVLASILSWAFFVGEPFLVCPYLGLLSCESAPATSTPLVFEAQR